MTPRSFSLFVLTLSHMPSKQRENDEEKGAKSFDARHLELFCMTGFWQSKEDT